MSQTTVSAADPYLPISGVTSFLTWRGMGVAWLLTW